MDPYESGDLLITIARVIKLWQILDESRKKKKKVKAKKEKENW